LNRRLADQIDEILRFVWSANPTAASAAGIHDHDGRLVDCSGEALEERLRILTRYSEDLSRLDGSSPALTPDESLDVRVLNGFLKAEARLLSEARMAHRDPAYYLDEVLYGVYYLVERAFAPAPHRASAAARRLRQVPRLLREARANLSDPSDIPPEWVGAAERQIPGSLSFLSALARGFTADAGAAAPEFESACAAAIESIEEFRKHLTGGAFVAARGRFAAGRGLFEHLLRVQHGIEQDAETLDALGRRLVAETRARLERAARAIDERRAWQDLLGEWKSDHPDEGRLIEEYRAETTRAREFVRSRGLATLPPGETLRVIATPPFQRSVTPFAAYVAPAAFEEDGEGVLWVTPPEEDAPPDVRARLMQEHLRPAIAAAVAHEAYPGHHLQLSLARRVPSRVRRYCATSVFVEGWAFYCEELMAEQSYYPDARSRVLQLRDALWRAARIVIDVRLHTRAMSLDEAAATLVETARLEPSTARAEVLRYTRTPTQPLSYAVGRQAILDLREEMRRRRGAAFDLGRFHDDLLSYGSIPIAFIRERMLAGEPGAGGADGT
jgi:uncharacterized protein DUF885